MTELETIISECEANAIPDSEIDTSEIPPVTDFSGFQFGNPMLREPQNEQVSLRINKILLAHFRSKGKGWQKQLNYFLMTAYLNGQI